MNEKKNKKVKKRKRNTKSERDRGIDIQKIAGGLDETDHSLDTA